MSPIILLKELSLLKNNKTVLDVGTKDGSIALQFADLGMQVDAIDINDLLEAGQKINFEKIGIEDFLLKNTKCYDVVVCRHVLHHLDNPIDIITRLNKIAGIFFFTCFGEKDEWADRVSTVRYDEVIKLFPEQTIKHRSESFQYGKTYSGDTKFWHINTFVIDNR